MSKKVLLIEDSRTIRRQVGAVLFAAGYDVIEADDGVHGLTLLHKNRDTAMVLCDVNMPRMSGHQFVECSRAAGHQVPVVMLTTDGDVEGVQRAKSLGAKGWIVKPFNADRLLSAVKAIIG